MNGWDQIVFRLILFNFSNSDQILLVFLEQKRSAGFMNYNFLIQHQSEGGLNET